MEREPSVLTIARAAADLQTTEPRLWKFHREGRLAIMYMAGSPTAARRGAKDGRIDREEWERFKRDLTVTYRPEPPVEPVAPRRGRPPKDGASRPGTFAERFAVKVRRRGES
jgi:hypothetical protein